jgi:ADP-heptose:LPS heptosyltransferase
MSDKQEIEVYILGGIGDVIFGLEGIRQLKTSFQGCVHVTCHLISHADQAAADLVFANPFVDKLVQHKFEFDVQKNFALVNELSASPNFFGNAADFCNTIFPEIYTSVSDKELATEFIKSLGESRRVIAIHMFGSPFSNYYLSTVRGVGQKDLEYSKWNYIVKALLSEAQKNTVLALGNEKDAELIDKWLSSIEDERFLNIAGKFSITTVVEIIRASNIVVAVDSAIKSISLALKVPTIVLINDHDDVIRDLKFIKPYEESNESKISVIRSANKLTLDKLVNLIVKDYVVLS